MIWVTRYFINSLGAHQVNEGIVDSFTQVFNQIHDRERVINIFSIFVIIIISCLFNKIIEHSELVIELLALSWGEPEGVEYIVDSVKLFKIQSPITIQVYFWPNILGFLDCESQEFSVFYRINLMGRDKLIVIDIIQNEFKVNFFIFHIWLY